MKIHHQSPDQVLFAPRFPADIPCRTNPDMWTDPKTRAEAEYAASLCSGCPSVADCEQQAMTLNREDRFNTVWHGHVYAPKEWRIREKADQPHKPRKKPVRTKPLTPCGTHAAYNRHTLAGEEPCEPCRKAQAAYHRGRRAKQRQGAS